MTEVITDLSQLKSGVCYKLIRKNDVNENNGTPAPGPGDMPMYGKLVGSVSNGTAEFELTNGGEEVVSLDTHVIISLNKAECPPFQGGGARKTRRRRQVRKQSRRKQSRRKQSRRKQSRRKQSRRKQSRRKQSRSRA